MRALTPEFRAAAKAGLVRVGVMAEIDYPGAPFRAWTGPTQLVWDAKEWSGVGNLGGISAVQESSSPEAPAMTLEISGISSASIALALDETSQRRRATVWLSIFELVGEAWQVVPDPWRLRRGWTDVHKLMISGKTATIQVTVESIFVRLKTARTMRYSDADQQRLFPGDTGFRYANTIGERPIYWGVATPTGAISNAGGNIGSGRVNYAL
ncbi:hypothetical protein [Opitutus terrae]|uniref:Uncharacterized protein n=1 Tax=Opitutus terrae (strain DSM 11246 / JCM 15787 / PB90-1) TaxID=452637 RepID=B1ZV45_OPITP|nr:hypothetical protein [Opitutus terrae]ACB76712.1 conserved hypothetical protein [Opitutus terrae PB90-1]